MISISYHQSIRQANSVSMDVELGKAVGRYKAERNFEVKSKWVLKLIRKYSMALKKRKRFDLVKR